MTFYKKLNIEANWLGNNHNSPHIESARDFRRNYSCIGKSMTLMHCLTNDFRMSWSDAIFLAMHTVINFLLLTLSETGISSAY